MRIHALTSGHITAKQAFLHVRTGLRRRLDLLLPGPWVGALQARMRLVPYRPGVAGRFSRRRAGFRCPPVFLAVLPSGPAWQAV